MSAERAKQFADQAALALQSGDPQLALELCQEAKRLDPQNWDLSNLAGVSSSLLGQSQDAVAQFIEAASATAVAKPLFNLAVHYYRLGDLKESELWTRRALDREPNHSEALTLLELLTGEAGGGSEPARTGEGETWKHAYAVAETPMQPGGDIELLRKHRALWSSIAVGLTLTSVFAYFRALPEAQGSGLSALSAFLLGASYLATLGWLIIDGVSLRRTALWPVGFALLGCFSGPLILVAYLVTGPKQRGAPSV